MLSAVWMVLAGCCAVNALTCGNVAVRGNATQSSTNWGGDAHQAIDGDRNAYYHNKSCTHTKSELRPWWSVDLLSEENVLSVKITNRLDCCWKRFKNVEVYVGTSYQDNGNNNPLCGMIESLEAGGTALLNCHGMNGRFVNVVLRGEGILTLCEVEIYVKG
ncbi:fucolectin-like [Leucoraja erinacea]|uniref:fucolectin-like n=1 Tax=Leucoraja erinaceus TaxID=7782 RepID=UPI002455FA6A|nr:fucolectin-like [Leucoraja erinacea]